MTVYLGITKFVIYFTVFFFTRFLISFYFNNKKSLITKYECEYELPFFTLNFKLFPIIVLIILLGLLDKEQKLERAYSIWSNVQADPALLIWWHTLWTPRYWTFIIYFLKILWLEVCSTVLSRQSPIPIVCSTFSFKFCLYFIGGHERTAYPCGLKVIFVSRIRWTHPLDPWPPSPS